MTRPDPIDDPRVAAALTEYQARLEAGERPDPGAFAAAHPDVADVLAGCMRAIDFVRGAVLGPPPWPGGCEPGRVVGDFRIVREVGRGGMGVVYEAEQLSLGRRVALKVLPAGRLDDRAVQRFRHEAQAAAALRHPRIVPVYAVGDDAGVHYLAMQFVEGQSLADVVTTMRAASTANASTETGSPSPAPTPRADRPTVPSFAPNSPGHYREAARLIAQAADALHHAHEFGVVHRDIKPGNLLLDTAGDLWVADFGLARLPESDLTGTADVLGTVRYMSPEQAAGRGVLDHRTDVYSLGVTLYELLTLAPAFVADDRRALLRKVLEEDPTPPRSVAPGVPADLDTIARTATAKDPKERYQSARAMADDLTRFLEDRPITARPPTVLQRAGKWVKRNRVLVGVTGSVGLAALIVLVGVLAASNAAIDAKRQEAEDALGRESAALAAETEAKGRIAGHLAAERRTVYLHTIALAYREWQAGNLKRADRLLDECPPEHRRWEWLYLRRLTRPDWGVVPLDATASVLGLDVARNGDILCVDMKGWGRASIREGFRRGPGDRPAGAIWVRASLSPDERTAAFYQKYILVRGGDVNTGEVATIDLATGTVQTRFAGSVGGTLGVAYSPDGRVLAAWGTQPTFTLWDSTSGAPIATMSGHVGPIREVAFHPEGNLVASYGEDATLRFWATDTGRSVRIIRDERLRTATEDRRASVADEMDFSPDGRALAVGLPDGTVGVWDVETGESRLSFRAHSRGPVAVRYSPDGRWLATAGGFDGAVHLWSSRNGNPIAVLAGSDARPLMLRFEPAGRYLVTGRPPNREVRLWDLTTRQEARVLDRPRRPARDIAAGYVFGIAAYDPTGRRLVTATREEWMVWEPETGNPVGTAEHGSHQVLAAAFAPDGPGVTMIAHTGGLTWAPGDKGPNPSFPIRTVPRRSPTGAPILVPSPRNAAIVTIFPGQAQFTGDGSRFVAIDTTSTVSLYDAGGRVVRTLPAPAVPPTYYVAINSRGTRLATVGIDGVVTGWDAATGAALWRSEPLGGKVVALAFDPMGHRLAFGLEDGSVGMLAADGRPLHRLQGVGAPVLVLTFSPDGDRLVVGHGVRTDPFAGVRVWDAATGLELITVPLPGAVVGLAFRPDGLTLAALGSDGRVWLLEGGPASAADLEAARDRRWAAWHGLQAADAEAAREWWAARWHIDRMLAAKPGDAALLARRADLIARENQFGEPPP